MATTSDSGAEGIALDKPDTNNATFFFADDVDSSAYRPADSLYLRKQSHYEHLKDIHEGRKNAKWRNDPYITYEAARDLIKAVSSQLDLTKGQRHRVRRIFTHIDREKLGLPNDLVAVTACALVIEQDEQNETRRCHPNVPDEGRDSLFQQVEESLDLSHRDIQKTYGKLQYRLSGKPLPSVEFDKYDPDHYPGGGGI